MNIGYATKMAKFLDFWRARQTLKQIKQVVNEKILYEMFKIT